MTNAVSILPAAGQIFLSLLLPIGIFLVLAYLSKRLMDRSRAIGGTNVINVIGTSYIGVRKTIAMVEIPGAVLILGVTAERISLLARIDDPENMERIRAAQKQGPQGKFARQLKALVSKGGATMNRERKAMAGKQAC